MQFDVDRRANRGRCEVLSGQRRRGTFNRLSLDANRAGWVGQNFITEDTEALDARRPRRRSPAAARGSPRKRSGSTKSTVPRRSASSARISLKVSLVLATPSDPKEAEELTTLGVVDARRCAAKASGAPIPPSRTRCMNIDDITKVLATSRNEKEVRAAWEGWHTISPPIRKDYQRFVELSNKGAEGARVCRIRARCGARSTTWRRTTFTKELDRLWDQVRPLYLQLHAYVRMKLHQKCGDVVRR